MMNALTITNSASPARTVSCLDEVAERLSTRSLVPAPLRAAMGLAATGSIVFFMTALVGMGGCHSHHHDDAVGHTKTVETRVVDTPTEKTTITEKHEKDTKIVR